MNTHRSEFFRASLLIPFACREQGLERNASLMEAGASRQTTIDERYMPSKLCGTNSGYIAAWTGAKYKYINCCCHISDYHTFCSFYTMSNINCCGFSTSSLKRAR